MINSADHLATHKHTKNGMLSPVVYEIRQKKMNKAGV